MTKCARTSCPSTRNVVFVHRDTGARYCPKCAKAINAGNPGLLAKEKGKE